MNRLVLSLILVCCSSIFASAQFFVPWGNNGTAITNAPQVSPDLFTLPNEIKVPCSISYLYSNSGSGDTFGAIVFLTSGVGHDNVSLWYINPRGGYEYLVAGEDYVAIQNQLIIHKELMPGSKLRLEDLSDNVLATGQIPHKNTAEYNRFIERLNMAGAMRQQQYNKSPSGPKYSSPKYKQCSYCKGRGWVPGSKTTTYGLTGQYYCSDCGEYVNQSHSHDQCPSCGGTGQVRTSGY